MIILAGRAIMSWFPIRSDSPVASIYGILHDLTEPVLAPMRRLIPPAGMFDLSFLILFVLLVILRDAVC
jgi:YggT family protein